MDDFWLDEARESLASHRRVIERVVGQLSDGELNRRPQPEMNSVAALLRHLGGNLQSRWTDFLSSDGEKPSRDRDTEFADWTGSRESLLAYFDAGWSAFASTLASLTAEDLSKTVTIRGESHSVPQAILRALTHVAYHVGQIALVARLAHDGDWNWVTVAPGGSLQFNRENWGTSRARSGYAAPESAAASSSTTEHARKPDKGGPTT